MLPNQSALFSRTHSNIYLLFLALKAYGSLDLNWTLISHMHPITAWAHRALELHCPPAWAHRALNRLCIPLLNLPPSNLPQGSPTSRYRISHPCPPAHVLHPSVRLARGAARQGGFMESWSVASSSGSDGCVRSLGTVKVQGDKICCVADMARDPYVLLGCSSGSLRIATLVDDFGSPPKHPREARGFTIAPYRGAFLCAEAATCWWRLQP